MVERLAPYGLKDEMRLCRSIERHAHCLKKKCSKWHVYSERCEAAGNCESMGVFQFVYGHSNLFSAASVTKFKNYSVFMLLNLQF